MLVCLDQRNGNGCGTRHPNGTSSCQHCGNSLRYALELHDPGTIIGQYRVLRDIGFGGFGAVYAAEDMRQSGLYVALKETFNPIHIRSFQGEFAVLRRLHHDHLPRYYEMFEDGGNGYLVMELVNGQSLADILERSQGTPLVEAQVLGYALQLCDALSYLHEQTPPIIHRDTKPANIRLTPEGLIKLVDFGLLKQGTDATRSSRMGITPAYAPLEQYGGGTTPQSDIYSLGATLYHLFSGTCPLTVTERLARTPDPLLSPQQHNPRLSSHVAQAVIQAMGLYPQQRYANAAALKAALLKGNSPPTTAPIKTIPVSGPPPASKLPASSVAVPLSPKVMWFSLIWALVSTVGGGVAGLVGWWVWFEAMDYSQIVHGALFGAVGGFTQWLVLRHWLPRTGWWLLASTVGYVVGVVVVIGIVGDTVVGPVLWALGGAVCGCAQWLLLRRRLPRTGWWIPASMVGYAVSWAVGWAMYDIIADIVAWADMVAWPLWSVDAITFALVGLGYGLITGPVLAWLLRGRRQP